MSKMWSPLAILCVCLCLQHAKTITECPPHTIRLINSDDVALGIIENGTDFANLITTCTVIGFDTFLPPRNILPNTGSLQFHEPLLLVGFTTAGVGYSGDEYYVSNFTFQYSASGSGPYNDPFQLFIQDFVDEKAYVFNKTLLAKRIQFTIYDGEPQPGIGNSDTYEWRINLFGCLYSEGVDTEIQSTVTTTVTMTTSAISVSTSISEVSVTITTTIPMTTTVFLSTTCTVSSAQLDASQTVSQQSSAVYSCYGEIGTMALFLLLFIVTIIVLIIIIIICYKRKSQTSVSKRSRTNTLNELTNVYYTTRVPSEQSHDHIRTDDEMIENEAYLCSSGQILIKDVSSQQPINNDEYSSIDVYYPSNTSNASSNKYDYISTASNMLPSSPTDIIYEVDSTPNPCYTTH